MSQQRKKWTKLPKKILIISAKMVKKEIAINSEQNLPLYLFHQGTNYNAYEYMGAHFECKNNVVGVVFRVWAPNAKAVSVVGDFNNWNEKANPMTKISNGVFETFIEGLSEFDCYKYAIVNSKTILKADPYAFFAENAPKTASKLYNLCGYQWCDSEYMNNKEQPYSRPVNIYEVNLASWKRKKNGEYYSYVDLSNELVKYVVDAGYTHVEFMPVSEYPFDGSWGYQVTGYYAITSRFGTPKDFMYLVDKLHQNGIGVIVDWVPAHFPKDEHGLYEFDGSLCYENQGWDRIENKTWGTRLFDLGRNEVQSFLISNAVYMFEKFHIDGLRVDAVAAMLYLDYDKKDGEWIPNEYGGNYNIQAIEFFKKLNTVIFEKFPTALMIAEESTAFSMVTKPVYDGGLGFNFKWNMGWMNDTLSYIQCDPYFRSGCHDKLTFSMCYAFSENYILPISHDEVVHGKKSLLDKMHGDITDKFATLRTYMAYMYAHPGKKLSFMGNEYGQFKEWDYKEGLEFFMLKFQLHKKLFRFNIKLNHLYKSTPPLYEIEDSWGGFKWISADEKENNIFSFIRYDKVGNQLVAIFNFSGKDYNKYRLGLDEGNYKIVFNTDWKRFGGKGIINKNKYKTTGKGAHGNKNSITINLPRLSALYFVKTDSND